MMVGNPPGRAPLSFHVIGESVLRLLVEPARLKLLRPNDSMARPLRTQPAARLYTTSITQAEVLHGLMLLPQGRRRRALEAAAKSMFLEDFGGRILGFGTDAAPPYAQIASDRRRAGRPISHFDAQVGAIARSTGAGIATRNLADFEGCGVNLVDPWKP